MSKEERMAYLDTLDQKLMKAVHSRHELVITLEEAEALLETIEIWEGMIDHIREQVKA